MDTNMLGFVLRKLAAQPEGESTSVSGLATAYGLPDSVVGEAVELLRSAHPAYVDVAEAPGPGRADTTVVGLTPRGLMWLREHPGW